MDMQESVGGPFLQVAVFCEKILDEKDGVISAIRIVDRVKISASGKESQEKMPPMMIPITMLIRFKSGDASGEHELKVQSKSPSGKDVQGFTTQFVLGGGELSANIALTYNIEFEEAGIYWFSIIVDNKLYTKVSLNIIYEQKPMVSTSSSVAE